MSTWSEAGDESDDLVEAPSSSKDASSLRAPHLPPAAAEADEDWEDFDDEFDDDFDDALDQELEKELALKFADDGYGGLAGEDDFLDGPMDDELSIAIEPIADDDEEPADADLEEPLADAE